MKFVFLRCFAFSNNSLLSSFLWNPTNIGLGSSPPLSPTLLMNLIASLLVFLIPSASKMLLQLSRSQSFLSSISLASSPASPTLCIITFSFLCFLSLISSNSLSAILFSLSVSLLSASSCFLSMFSILLSTACTFPSFLTILTSTSFTLHSMFLIAASSLAALARQLLQVQLIPPVFSCCFNRLYTSLDIFSHSAWTHSLQVLHWTAFIPFVLPTFFLHTMHGCFAVFPLFPPPSAPSVSSSSCVCVAVVASSSPSSSMPCASRNSLSSSDSTSLILSFVFHCFSSLLGWAVYFASFTSYLPGSPIGLLASFSFLSSIKNSHFLITCRRCVLKVLLSASFPSMFSVPFTLLSLITFVS